MYFLLGGSITSVVAYLANNSKGFLAAFINTLPMTSLSTFVIIYVSTGQDAVLSYARGLVIMLLPWILYVLSVIILTPADYQYISVAPLVRKQFPYRNDMFKCNRAANICIFNFKARHTTV